MKITFIEPPSLNPKKIPERIFGCSYQLYHSLDLANLYILTLLDKQGFKMNYLDAILDKLSWPAFLKTLSLDDSKIYIIHSVILSKKADLFTIKKLRKYNPRSLILVHGPEPTRVPREYLLDPNLIVFRGEPEQNILRFLTKNKPESLSYLKKGEVIHLSYSGKPLDINTLPLPDRLHKSIADYALSYYNPKLSRSPQTAMITSRGCAFHCLFCVPNSISFAREQEHLKKHKSKPAPSLLSAERVISEFNLIKKQGFQAVMIIDDQFLWDRKRTIKICSGIRDLNLEWGCLSRADFLTDPKLVQNLAQAGCRVIDIGVESLNQKILNYIHKELKVNDIEKALANLKKYRIEAKFNIVFGAYPQETAADIKNTVKELKRMKVNHVMFSIATPFPGTPYHAFCKKKGYLKINTKKLDPSRRALVSYPNLSNQELEKMQKWAYRHFYLRPGFLKERIKTYKNPKNLTKDLKIITKILK